MTTFKKGRRGRFGPKIARGFLSLASWLGVSVLPSGAQNVQAPPVTILEFQAPADLGQPWNSITNTPAGSAEHASGGLPCVKFNVKKGTEGQQALTRLRFVETRSDLSEAFGLSASAKFESAIGGTKARIGYDENTQVSVARLNLAGTSYVSIRTDSTQAESGSGYTLTQAAIDALADGTFFDECGDSFVAQIEYGGLLLVRMRTSEESYVKSTKLRGELSQKFEGGEIDFSALSSNLGKKHSKDVQFFVSERGISGGDKTLSLEGVRDWVANYPKEMKANPAAIRIGVIPYTAISESDKFPDAKITDTILKFSQKYSELDSTYETMREMLKEQGSLAALAWERSVPVSCIKDQIEALRSYLNKLETALKSCRKALGGNNSASPVCDEATFDALALQVGKNTKTCPSVTISNAERGLDILDYRRFWGAKPRPDKQARDYHQKINRIVAELVYADWIGPIAERRCQQEGRRTAECDADFAEKFKANIPVFAPGVNHPELKRYYPENGNYRELIEVRGKNVRRCAFQETHWKSNENQGGDDWVPYLHVKCFRGDNKERHSYSAIIPAERKNRTAASICRVQGKWHFDIHGGTKSYC